MNKVERAVGIQAQLHLVVAETLADAFDEVKFIVEVDGTDLQFDTPAGLGGEAGVFVSFLAGAQCHGSGRGVVAV